MNFAKYLSVIAISMLKFAGGPLTGLAIKLSWIETAICSVVGMMITVSLIVFSGDFIRNIFRKDKPKSLQK
jgi:predicted tellurium resistance membrane protein TerC